jgi:hypothetical protein
MRVCSDEVILVVEVVLVSVSIASDLIDVYLVAQEATNATEAFDEGEAVRRLIRDKLDLNTVFLLIHQ